MRISGCGSLIRPVVGFVVTIALLAACLAAPQTGSAAIAVERHDLLTMEYQQVGANEEEAVRLAGIRAVHATIGRILFSDYGLQARDLLEPYVQKNWQKFVASSYVLERRTDRDGFGVRIRVQTLPETLARDLREKRFLYLPKTVPYHYVFMSENVDGRPSSSDLARRAISEAIVEEGGRVYSDGIASPAPNADVLSQPDLFSAAREAAVRRGASVIVAGRCVTTKVGEQEVLYDRMHTYETNVRIDILRADDGTVLGSAENVERASDANADTARDDSVRAAIRAGHERIAEQVRVLWKNTTLEKARFQVMFTNLTPAETKTLLRYLQAELGHGTKAVVRSYFGNVAILSIDTKRDFSAFERAVQGFKEFDLRIADQTGNRITVDVHH
jgi:hypothetical protein